MERQMAWWIERCRRKCLGKREEEWGHYLCVSVWTGGHRWGQTHTIHISSTTTTSLPLPFPPQSTFPLFVSLPPTPLRRDSFYCVFVRSFLISYISLSVQQILLNFTPTHSSLSLFLLFLSNHRIYHSDFSAIYFTITMARSNSPPALLPLNFSASLLLTLSPFTVGCDHIYWTMITPLIVFLFFLVFVFFLPPSLLQGGSRLLRQRSREIACYRGSIFHALVNCFVLTLCQSRVVTPAWATRNPVDALMISGCFHQDWGGQPSVCVWCV